LVDAFVEVKINNNGRRHAVLFFDAGAHDVSKKCGADYVRASEIRGFDAIFEAFSVKRHR
jgi:hypothetical protein